jgi:hypothetical protein
VFRKRRLRRELEPLLEDLERAHGREHTEARQRVCELGDEVTGLVVEASRKGRLAGWKCCDLLLELGPAGRQATLDCARRDEPLGGSALTALARLRDPPPEVVAVLRASLGHRDRNKILGLLGAIQELQPKAEPALGPGVAAELSALGPGVLVFLDHPEPAVQRQAASAVALLRPPGAAPVSRLLELARTAGSQDVQLRLSCTRALGAFGPAAAPALDWLRERVRDGDQAAILALGDLGATAAPALEELAAVRDAFEGPTQSDTKAFRSLVGGAMRSIRAAVEEEPDGTGPRPATSQLVDLLERIEGRDDRGSVVRSSSERASSKARDEANRLRDADLLDEIETLLANASKAKRFDSLVWVLTGVTDNTGDERGKRLLQRLLADSENDPKRLARVHWGLSRANVEEATDRLLDQLRRRSRGELDFDPYWLLDFFQSHPHPEAIRLFGEIALREAAFGSLVAMWLADLGRRKEPEVRRPLENLLLSEELGYRRRNDLDRRGSALSGLMGLADPRSVPAFVRELGKRQSSTYSSCLNALASIDDPKAVPAVLAGVRHALRQLKRTGHLSTTARFSSELVYLAPAVRYLARHLGKDAAEVVALEGELRAAVEVGDAPQSELELLDAPQPPSGGDVLRFDR